MRTMGGRPVLMQRFPQGASGKSFFQKRVPDGAPDWLQTTTVETVNGTPSRALVAADVAHVAWAVNLGLSRLPRRGPRAADPRTPTSCGSTSTPSPGTDFARSARRRASSRRCSTSSGSPASPRRPATADCTCTCAWSRAGTPTRCAPPRSPSRASSSAAGPTSSPPPGGRRSGASGSSSTTTRTRRTRRSSARGRCGPARARRSRRRSPGTSSTTSTRTSSRWPPCPARLERDGDPWAASRRRRNRWSRCWRCTSATARTA